MSDIKLSVDRLRVGIYVKLPVRWDDHPFMFSNFKINSQDQIDIIRSLGISHIQVNPDKSDCAPLPPNPPRYSNLPISPVEEEYPPLTKEAMQASKIQALSGIERYRFSQKRTAKRLDEMLVTLDEVFSERPNQGIVHEKAEQLIDDLLSHIDTNKSVMIHCIHDYSPSAELVQHSMNVAMLGMLLAKCAHRDQREIKLVGLAGLYHDLAKCYYPEQPVEEHPKITCGLLRKSGVYNQPLANIILQHHEYLDGSGYPAHLISEQIDPLAQLLATCNHYDNLCRSTLSGERKPSLTAMARMYREYSGLLNGDYLGLLTRLLGVYPPGSWLKLSSDEFAQVCTINSEKLLYPCVKVFKSGSDEPEWLDLEESSSEIFIDRPIAIENLPEKLKALSQQQNPGIYGIDGND